MKLVTHDQVKSKITQLRNQIELGSDEWKSSKSQIVTSKTRRGKR
jgi:hypothetical protein